MIILVTYFNKVIKFKQMGKRFVNSISFLVIGCLFVFTNCSDSNDDIVESKILESPIASAATNITSSSFTANWTRVYQADGYEIDVSKSENFGSFLTGYNAKLITGLNNEVLNLEKATNYYYRVRAVNSNSKSKNSGVIHAITLDENGSGPTTSLKSAATTFSVGTITRSAWVNSGGQHAEILKQEFNNLTSEYEMKMNVMYPSEGNYDFSAADAIVEFALANDMNVHGHALIWHNATPSWVENFSGTDAEFEAMVEDYITTTVTRYKGKVRSWDVVNEGINDSNGSLRQTVFSQKMGDDYISKCFKFARNADPDVLLFYNDYSVVSNETKQTAIFDLIDDMKTNNVPIDGVGFQMHIDYRSPSTSQMEAAIDKAVERDLKLHFSELDIRANPNGDQSSLTSDRAEAQKAKYKEVVKIYNSIPLDNKFAITVWGVRDNESWLIDFWGNPEWPLLFDASYNKKPAYYGYLEGLQ